MLVVLVVRDGADWLKRCLAGLGRQTHPRLGVVAIDNASSDGSGDILAAALGPNRVLRSARNLGFNQAIRMALSRPLAEKADYILALHDDTTLSPDAVARMVDAAARVDRPGVVGPKILDAEEPRVLREVGLASDRFAYPYSPLEDDEIDQGQYDSPREVLYVSSAAMLFSREAWTRAGSFDERLDTCHGDLDFCWRVRLAGFRVLVDPRAVVLHLSAGEKGVRPGSDPDRALYQRERAGLLSLIKNYRVTSLLWVLPLYFLQGAARVAAYLLTRRFGSAGQVLAAWGWNVRHLGGTLGRRPGGRTTRRVADREVVRYMAPAGARLRRWFLQASSVLIGSRAGPLEPDPDGSRLRSRVAGLLGAHPVALGWMVALVLSLVAFREVLFSPELQGGALPRLPGDAGGLFGEFGSGWRSAGFGAPGGASPALVPLGVGSLITLNDPGLLLRLIVSAGLVLAAVFAYRALVGLTEDRSSAVAGAACYALSAVVMWAVSEGRIGVIVFLAAVPWLATRTLQAFSRGGPRSLAWVAGTGAGLAVTTSFFPSAWLSLAVLVVGAMAFPPKGGSRLRGAGLMGAAFLGGALLIFPFTVTLIAAGGAGAVDAVGRPDILSMLRLAPGSAPGSWAAAAFLPVSGVLAFAMTDDRRGAWREVLGAGACLLLAWLAAARWLPASVANPVAFLGTAAFLFGALVASALATLTAGVHRRAFGHRQLAVGVLGALVVSGLILQSMQALIGGWGVGRDRIAPAWAVVATADPGATFRVLWLGEPGGAAFPAPGGSPDGEVTVGRSSVRYGITDRQGRSVATLGLPVGGPAFDRLEDVLGAVLAGRIRHAGALLAVMGVRYVVAGQGDLPREAMASLSGQVDLDLIQHAGGLRVYRSAVTLPVAWAGPGRVRARTLAEVARAAEAGALAGARPLRRVAPGRWVGRVRLEQPGTIVLGTRFDPRWRLGGSTDTPFPVLGWAVGFDVAAGRHAVVAGFGGQAARSAEVAAMAVLWLAVLWLTRRGPRRGTAGS